MKEATLEALAAEHEKHATQIDLLERALGLCSFDSPELRERMAAVDDGLVEHLRWEEAELFPWLLRVLPLCTDQVERLEREHIDIVAAATILRLAQSSAHQSVRPMEEASMRFVQLLRSHLHHEERLIAEATLADPDFDVEPESTVG